MGWRNGQRRQGGAGLGGSESGRGGSSGGVCQWLAVVGLVSMTSDGFDAILFSSGGGCEARRNKSPEQPTS
ncbi:hypothetical protein PR202_gb21214 [Eleusine coracana subsp. coracana]|uniref:Uncharacterized protein n=1 Tax=Eleusine coracana subsp. coracana TaxID=191504 RepID=A0AAV5FDH8_ELECO|nr:hypothetical protein PR202_gb21214 [Eleusine coracana subsp. coracana]